ncbi:Phage Tail Collar Domain protein [compost metagenome]
MDSKANTDTHAPVSEVAFFARNTAPPGWLKCNGAQINRTAYAALFAVIGTTYGPGDGFNTFNLPELRGEFIRGWDDGRGVDVGRVFSSGQADQFQDHHHQFSISNGTGGTRYPIGDNNQAPANWPTSDPISGRHGSETRPRNVAMLACIKF